jgi:hypothetical protein
MPLTKLQFRPGINRELTSYSNEGGWVNGDKVRFIEGYPQKLGGWQKYSQNTFVGKARALKPFTTLTGIPFLGVGTTFKYYINEGVFHDITPIRLTTSAGDVTFSATNGSATITVADTDHGAVKNDFVTFSGASSLGGLVTATILNAEFQIVEIINANSYTITVSVTANSSDSGNGGGSVVGAYQVNVGLDTAVGGTGWGAGGWSRGTWNSAANVSIPENQLRIWTHDNFGEDLLINIYNGGIFYWDQTTGTGARAVELKNQTNVDSTAPTIARQVLVSDRDRHIIVFACDPETAIGTQDPLLIRFSDIESTLTWSASATNEAGSLRIGNGSEIICAVETKNQILVFTDVSLHSMQFIGPPFIFGINLIAENITIAGPLVAKAVNDNVYWMGADGFYVYTGQTQKLPCPLKSYIFTDFNFDQQEKAFAALNSEFNEIWWFYPSASSEEPDRYAIYNYVENSWSIGTLNRTAWVDKGVLLAPIAASTDQYLYSHETGLDDGSTLPNSAISSFIESSQITMGDGDRFSFISRILPDLTFIASTATSPSASLTVKARNFPGGDYLTTESGTVTRTVAGNAVTQTVEQFTNKIDTRLRGRSFAFRIDSTTTEVQWKLGNPRVDVRPDGRR